MQISQALSYVEGLGDGAAMFHAHVTDFRAALEEASAAAAAEDAGEAGIAPLPDDSCC